MKAILILLSAVLVTTINSAQDINVIIADKSEEDGLDSFFTNWRLTKAEKITEELCSERAKGVFSFYDYSVVLAMLGRFVVSV